MGSILSDSDRAALCQRIASVTSTSVPRWGRMDVSAMLAHLRLSALMALGELAVANKSKRAFQVFPIKHLILHVAPFPKGAPTAPELLVPSSTPVDAIRSELLTLVQRIGEGPREGHGAVHPLFGRLSFREWGVATHKHTDHHLRQFGAQRTTGVRVMLELPNSGVETIPAPSLGPRRAIWVFLAYFASQIATGAVVGVVGGVGYLLTHPTDPGFAGAQRMLLMPAAFLGLIVGGMVAFRMTRRSLPGAITGGALRSIGQSHATTRELLLASTVGVALAFLYLFGLVPTSSPSSGQHWGPIATAANAGGWPRHLWAVLALLVAPPVEEFVFRGVLFAGVRQSWTQGAAGFLVTFLFVAAHFSEIAGYGPATVAVALVGAATLIARIATDSLAPAIALHASYNLGLVVVVYATAA